MRNGPKSIYTITAPWDISKATWKIPWNHAGGDFDSLKAVAQGNYQDTITWEDYDVTAAVQQFVKNPSSNYGFLIKFDDADRRGIMVYSSQYTEIAKRPKLAITYNGTTAIAVSQEKEPYAANLRVLGKQIAWRNFQNRDVTIFLTDLRGRITPVGVCRSMQWYTFTVQRASGIYVISIKDNSSGALLLKQYHCFE